MLKKLFNWLFAREDDAPKQVRVYDFTTRGPGNDIALRVIGDGEYAEAVVFLDVGDDLPDVGDFIVVDLSEPEDIGDNIYTFIVDSVATVSLGVSKLTMSRYEVAENS